MRLPRLIRVVTVLAAVYGAVFLAIQIGGWGPQAIHENGAWRNVTVALFYLSCVEMLLSIPLERWATRHQGTAPTSDE